MASVCWLEDRDERLAAARALASTVPRGALAVVDGVLAEVPDDLEALRARAEILAEVGDADGARQALERVVELEPREARALIDLGDLARDPARAVLLYERAIALLEGRGSAAAPDLSAARRGRAALTDATWPARRTGSGSP